MKPLKAKPGVIVKIPVKDEVFVYAQLLEKGCIAIFDFFVEKTEDVEIENVLNRKVIFSPTIFKQMETKVINKGLWPIVGIAPITESITSQVRPQFHYNSSNRALLFYDGTEVEDVNADEFYGLFPISVYNEHNVQKLISAYYENRYAFSEVLALLQVYFVGEVPYNIVTPNFYLQISRSRPLPKPNELEGEEKRIWEDANINIEYSHTNVKAHYEFLARFKGG